MRFTKDHEWIKIEDQDNQIASVGITNFAQGELGEIVYVEVESVGETMAQNDVFGTIEAVKTTSDLFLPVDGEILEFNSELDESEGDNPALVNSDPHGAGWIVKIKLTNPAQLDELMDEAAYNEMVN